MGFYPFLLEPLHPPWCPSAPPHIQGLKPALMPGHAGHGARACTGQWHRHSWRRPPAGAWGGCKTAFSRLLCETWPLRPQTVSPMYMSLLRKLKRTYTTGVLPQMDRGWDIQNSDATNTCGISLVNCLCFPPNAGSLIIVSIATITALCCLSNSLHWNLSLVITLLVIGIIIL